MRMRGRDFKEGIFIGAIGGVLIGAIVGAVVGVLIAPQSGEETRESLCEYASELKGKAKEGGRHLIESGRDLLKQGTDQVVDLVRTGREQTEALCTSAEETAKKSS